jgi:uncharacterized protein YigE (DUF2233 family)
MTMQTMRTPDPMRYVLTLLLAWVPVLGAAATCTDQVFEDVGFSVCDVDVTEDLRLFHSGSDGVYGTFSAVNDALAATGKTLEFAMNAGMYHPDRAPVGLYVEDGVERAPIVTRDGPGNFGLLPNGVFCIGDRLRVLESRTYDATRPDCRFATQSGPMLVINGALHPALVPDSPSLNIRNGVGVSADGTHAQFVISNAPVNFHRFARFFRDVLDVPNALYFDGSISRLYAPGLGRDDPGLPMGPMVGTVIPQG